MAKTKVTSASGSDICFLIGPIGTANSEARVHADWIAHIVGEALEEFDLMVIRADQIPSPGQITAQIIDHVMNARLVIADLTFLNANAFYELGIRHAFQRPTIHLFRDGEDIPFDVADSRAIPISYKHPRDVEHAKHEIKRAAEQVYSSDYKVWSPVTGAIAYANLSTSDQETDRALAQVLAKVDALESQIKQSDFPFYARKEQENRIEGYSSLSEEVDPENLPGWVKEAALYRYRNYSIKAAKRSGSSYSMTLVGENGTHKFVTVSKND